MANNSTTLLRNIIEFFEKFGLRGAGLFLILLSVFSSIKIEPKIVSAIGGFLFLLGMLRSCISGEFVSYTKLEEKHKVNWSIKRIKVEYPFPTLSIDLKIMCNPYLRKYLVEHLIKICGIFLEIKYPGELVQLECSLVAGVFFQPLEIPLSEGITRPIYSIPMRINFLKSEYEYSIGVNTKIRSLKNWKMSRLINLLLSQTIFYYKDELIITT